MLTVQLLAENSQLSWCNKILCEHAIDLFDIDVLEIEHGHWCNNSQLFQFCLSYMVKSWYDVRDNLTLGRIRKLTTITCAFQYEWQMLRKWSSKSFIVYDLFIDVIW